MNARILANPGDVLDLIWKLVFWSVPFFAIVGLVAFLFFRSALRYAVQLRRQRRARRLTLGFPPKTPPALGFPLESSQGDGKQ
jgi:hypothetical protein